MHCKRDTCNLQNLRYRAIDLLPSNENANTPGSSHAIINTSDAPGTLTSYRFVHKEKGKARRRRG